MSVAYQGVSEKVAVRLRDIQGRRLVLGMRSTASARGRSRQAQASRACVPEPLGGLMVARYGRCEGFLLLLALLDTAKAWAATPPKA